MAAGCGHEHHHGHDDADHVKAGEGQQDILFLDIDREQVTALNEKQTGSAAHIIRPYDQRMSDSPLLESDVDDELMVYVPFTGSVRLRSLLLRSGPGHATPRAIHLSWKSPYSQRGSPMCSRSHSTYQDASAQSAASPMHTRPSRTSASAASRAYCSAAGPPLLCTRLRHAPPTTPAWTAPRPARDPLPSLCHVETVGERPAMWSGGDRPRDAWCRWASGRGPSFFFQ